MALPSVDSDYLLKFLSELLSTPSPTGFAHQAITLTEKALADFPELRLSQTRKGALVAEWPGERSDIPRALTAHTDTLGAMVKEIKSNGRLKLTKIGGYAWNTVEGEGCTVFTNQGGVQRGSILLAKASTHVYGNQVNELKREDDTMEVRLDVKTTSQEETEALGIQVGDFVAFDPRVEITNGFVRSRHLDDKACVACLLAAIKALHDAGLSPAQTTYFHISNYEEVGHGAAAGIPAQVAELVVVDMAAVGDGQSSDEFHVREGLGRSVSSRVEPENAPACRRARAFLQDRHLPLLRFRWRGLLARRRRRSSGADWARGRCFSQLRAHPPGSAGRHDTVGGGVSIELIRSSSVVWEALCLHENFKLMRTYLPFLCLIFPVSPAPRMKWASARCGRWRPCMTPSYQGH